MTHLVSVIIPYYKGERFIKETLDSIFAQHYSNLEIIIVNDGSPEETLGILESFGDSIKIISQENRGQAAARNLGIKYAGGSIIALLDQDDLWPSNHLGLMLPFLTEGNGFDFVRGMTQKFFVRPDGSSEMREPMFCEELIGAALYKKEVFAAAGLFDETMREGEDFDWNIRLAESDCKEKRISDITLLCRRHDSNQSDTKDFVKNGQLVALRKKIERMRVRAH